ncbi:ATP-binding cassette sub-family A member 17-like [Tenrec ecaudatus]|uniref:ATP-binding cassette sub-family A member 17-like n=1 Tax=Tenrec ecaudatus TaxID=94439 RepID=UPI003F59F734
MPGKKTEGRLRPPAPARELRVPLHSPTLSVPAAAALPSRRAPPSALGAAAASRPVQTAAVVERGRRRPAAGDLARPLALLQGARRLAARHWRAGVQQGARALEAALVESSRLTGVSGPRSADTVFVRTSAVRIMVDAKPSVSGSGLRSEEFSGNLASPHRVDCEARTWSVVVTGHCAGTRRGHPVRKMTTFNNLKLLLWKNFILKKRKPLITLLEILMPFLFSAIVIYLRFNSLPKKMPSSNYYPIDISALPGYFYYHTQKSIFQLVYIPSHSATVKSITEMVEKSFDIPFEVLGCQSNPEFESYITDDPKGFYALAGIVFDHNFNGSKDPLPLSVRYSLRFSAIMRNFLQLRLLTPLEFEGWTTSWLYPPNPGQEPRENIHNSGGHPGYHKEGFLAIQHAVDKAIMWHHVQGAMTQMFDKVSVLLKRFPYGPYIQDHFFMVLQNEFSPLLMLSFICIELTIINSITVEKERKLKEYMCMMGLHNWLHWVAWFIMFFLSISIVVSFMTVLFCMKISEVAVFNNSDPRLIFLFLMCFALATLSFAFMASTFFTKAHMATSVGGILFFFTYLPYLYISFSYTERTHLQKITSCLFSNVAMALGIRFISFSEARGEGLQWSNIGSVRGDFSFAQVLLMLLFDAFFYGLVAWYLESILPGAYGTPKPWYFVFKVSPDPDAARVQTRALERFLTVGSTLAPLSGRFIQEEPVGLTKGIEILHLYKVFQTGRKKTTAVRDLTLNLYQGQITVLLGHNGAGKSTTCSVLTGLLPASSGKVYINGKEISKGMDQVRKSLGWCPQHDILFDALTVTEHLYFYAQLKGLSLHKCWEEVRRMLRILDLEDKQDAPSKFLSGGMKRKLSIGIALIGGSKVLMLDEPTSGMDAISRRAIWDLLQQQKSDRTILLTTHFMDEADLLGDRITIMAQGELQCCGSSLFLKQKYGAGYYMTLVQNPHCHTEEVTRLVYQHIPNAILEASLGEELTFLLPKDSIPRFESLFSELELRQEELGISSFGASVTTMEEVFVHSDNGLAMPDLLVKPPPGKKFHLLCQQFYAMLLKRVTYTRRNWMMMLLIKILVPLAVVTFSLMVFSLQTLSLENRPLELTLRIHGRTIVPFSIPSNSSLAPRLTERFVEMLEADLQIPLEVSGSMDEFLLRRKEEEPEGFDKLYLVAVSIEDVQGHSTVTVLFNNQAYHSPALALALVDNFLFRLLSGTGASISVTNHPQPLPAAEVSENILHEDLKLHSLVLNLLFGMAFLASSFSILTVKENASKAKHIQFVGGVHVATFWIPNLLWDLITVLEPSLLLLVVFLYYREEAFTYQENSLAVLLTLMLYGWAIIPFVYVLSFCFASPGSAFIKLIFVLTFLSISPFILVSATSRKDLNYKAISQSLDNAFLVFPGHCLGMAFSNLYYNFGFQKFCNAKKLNKTDCIAASEGYTVQENIFAWESLGIGKYVTALAISGPVYLALLFLIETSTLRRLRARLSNCFRMENLEKTPSPGSAPEDQDVAEERETIQKHLGSICEQNPLVLKEMSKVYFTEVPLLAVNKVSFAVHAQECFGLLGINGAGKTSIFKILTGEEFATSGDAFVQRFSINSDLGEVRQHIGYCPQFDALLEHLTARETLVLYARLRGVPERHIGACVEDTLRGLLLEPHANKLVRTYSGGNKRKLSTGIALIGDPAVIFLDEPSTGMDPMARRLLWDTLARARESGKAIVITSHSMEECEALCTRLAIMVQGQFKCLGSPQHLKSKFGSGYSLRAKVHSEDGQKAALDEFKAFVSLTFPGSILEDEHQGLVHYHLPAQGLSWAKMFGTLERAREKFQLDDYVVSQVSLEDVFLSLASPTPPSQSPDAWGWGQGLQ